MDTPLHVFNNSIYVLDFPAFIIDTVRINRYTLSGVYISRFSYPGNLLDFVVLDTVNLFCRTDEHLVCHYNWSGALIDTVTISDSGQSFWSRMRMQKSMIVAMDKYSPTVQELVFLNPDLSISRRQSLPGSMSYHFAIDSSGYIYHLGGMYDTEGVRVASFCPWIIEKEKAIEVDNNFYIYLGDTEGNVTILRKR